MTLTDKVLAFIQLASVKGDIYDPPASTFANVHNIIFFNANTVAETVQLFYDDGTNEFQLFEEIIQPQKTVQWDFIGEGDIVEVAGKYTGNSTNASQVTCKVIGTEDSS